MSVKMTTANAVDLRNVANNRTSPSQKKWLPILLVILNGSLLALSLIIGKLGISAGAAPLGFLSFALLVSGSLLCVVSLLRSEAAPIRGRVLEYGFVAGLLFLLPNMVGFMAVRHVGAGFLSLTFLFPLLITYLIALLIRMETFAVIRACAVLLGLAGGGLLAMSKASLGDAPLFWILLTLSGPFIIAMGNLYRTLRWPEGVAPQFLASQMLLAAGLMLTPIAMMLEGVQGFQSVVSSEAIPYLLAQILVFSTLYRLYFVLQKVAGPVYLSQMGSVAAVVGGAIATWFLGETMPPNLGIAALLVGAGIVLFQYRR